jgi:hypothetical protein
MPKQKMFAKQKNGLTLFPGNETSLALSVNFKREGSDDPEQSTAFGQAGAYAEKLLEIEENKETGKISGVRCYVLRLNLHCNTTHTENIGHFHQVLTTMKGTAAEVNSKYLRAALITVVPVKCTEAMLHLHPHAKVDDFIITQESIEAALKNVSKIFDKPVNALIVRCDHETLLDKEFHTFRNPPYFALNAMDYIVDNFSDVGREEKPAKKVNIQHLLSNLPSIDPESDEGALVCHARFFGATKDKKGYLDYTESGRMIRPKMRTNTEMLHLTRQKPDGCYFLKLNIAAFDLDHALSLPVLSDVISTNLYYDDFSRSVAQSPNLNARRPC